MKRLILFTIAILAFCGIFAQAVNPTIWKGTGNFRPQGIIGISGS